MSWGRAALWGSVGLTCLLLLALARGAGSGAAPSTLALLLALAFVPYAWLASSAELVAPREALGLGFAAAAIAGTALVLAPVSLSDDVYRYLWDARVTLSGHNPYAHAPVDPVLAALRNADWQRINHPEVPTVYPPLAEAFFVLCAALWQDVRIFKLMALVLHLLSAMLVFAAATERATRAALLCGLNPLALTESALGGHVDTAVALTLVAFVLALGSGRPGSSALLLGIVSGLKLVGLALVPLLARAGGRAWLLALGLSLVAFAPFAMEGHAGTSSGLGHYAQRWRGNEAAFALLDRLTRGLVDAAADARRSPPGQIELRELRTLLARLRSSALDPHAVLVGEKKQLGDVALLPRHYVAGLLARLLALALLLGYAMWAARCGCDAVLATRNLVLVVLLLSPQVHPWYLVWLIPLEVMARRTAGLVWSATAALAYAPLDGWVLAHRWTEPAMLKTLEYAPVLAVMAFESQWLRRYLTGRPLPLR